MRRIVLLTTTVMLLALPMRAEANHRPTAHCSPSGDVCQSTRLVEGVRRLRIGLFAKFFDQYRLCVKAPDGSRTCRVFEIRDKGATFGSSVRWGRYFPLKGFGAYVVTWWTGEQKVGRTLGFHRKAPA
jgi:hypothetical protein